VDVYFSETGTLKMPGSNVDTRHASLGLSKSASYRAKYVSSVEVGDRGQITVTLRSLDELPENTARGKKVIYSPRNQLGNLEWVVTKGTDSVADKYLPRR
jgi:hypothetical protein